MLMANRYNRFVEWQSWITSKYLLWRIDKPGRRGSASQYARLLGISPQLLSDWMNKGQSPREPEIIKKLFDFFGDEVYSILGLPLMPSSYESRLPREMKDRLNQAIRETNEYLTNAGLTGDEPEAETVTRKIFERHGFRYTTTEESDDAS